MWVKLCSDFASVAEYAVSSRTFLEEAPTELIAFCDASKQANGFVLYAIQEGRASFFFSKVKVAPLSFRTLPTLELLAILLALNCLNKILINTNFCQTKIFNIHILPNSQVTLTWVFKGHALKFNAFVNNRLKDIRDYLKILTDQKESKVQSSFSPTHENIADLVTRELSLQNYQDNFARWVWGPSWLTEPRSSWPSGNLGCIPVNNISEEPALMLNPTLVKLPEYPISIENFSSWPKLLYRYNC